MDKNERLFRIIAVAGLGLGIYSVIRYEMLLNALKDMNDTILTEIKFADIVDHFKDEEGDTQ